MNSYANAKNGCSVMASLIRNDDGGEDFDAESLARILFDVLNQREGGPFCVALSGGADSCVLLHALVELRRQGRLVINALHVNHGLHPQAAVWEAHCVELCRTYSVPLETGKLDIGDSGHGGVEARARAARYAWFEARIGDGTLLTAHHRDDQVETVLLRLLRGTGIAGVSGMRAIRPLGRGWVMRPLLKFWRADLERYARDRALKWVTDPSNADLGLARNYMRHRVLPVVTRRWPTAPAQIARFAEHAGQAQTILEAVAASDLDNVTHRRESAVSGGGGRLRLADVVALENARLRNLIRHWFQQCGFAAPSARRLEEIIRRMVQDLEGSATVMAWSGRELRRYDGWLYLMRALRFPDARDEWSWDMRAPLQLPVIDGCLHAQHATGAGLALARIAAQLTVRWRRGGESCRLPGRDHRHVLKKLFQENRIPPWQRSRIPLLYTDDCLAAVVGLWYCEPFCARAGEPSVEFTLRSVGDDAL